MDLLNTAGKDLGIHSVPEFLDKALEKALLTTVGKVPETHLVATLATRQSSTLQKL